MSYSNPIVNSYRNAGYSINFFHANTKTSVTFDAYITSFTDSYQPSWETMEKGINTQDNFKKVINVTRKISIGFDVPSVSLEEAKSNLSKMRTLARILYPTLDQYGNISQSPEIMVYLLNLICDYNGSSILAMIESVSIVPTIDEGFLDPGPGLLYPKSFKVDLSFDVQTMSPDPASVLYPTEEEPEATAAETTPVPVTAPAATTTTALPPVNPSSPAQVVIPPPAQNATPVPAREYTVGGYSARVQPNITPRTQQTQEPEVRNFAVRVEPRTTPLNLDVGEPEFVSPTPEQAAALGVQ